MHTSTRVCAYDEGIEGLMLGAPIVEKWVTVLVRVESILENLVLTSKLRAQQFIFSNLAPDCPVADFLKDCAINLSEVFMTNATTHFYSGTLVFW
jgi:hypothetical protein